MQVMAVCLTIGLIIASISFGLVGVFLAISIVQSENICVNIKNICLNKEEIN